MALSNTTAESLQTSNLSRQASEDGEQTPLLHSDTQRSSNSIGPQQFEHARQEAAAQAALESGWFTWCLVLFAFCIFAFWFYVNIRSWYVLFMYYDSPCDQPLPDWLLVKLMLDVLSSSAQQRQRSGDPPRNITWFILACQNVWLVLGFHWSSECNSCQTTNPELYAWVKFLVIFGFVVTIFLMLLPVLFYMGVMVFVHLIGTGRIKNYRAAREDTLSSLERIEYCPETFADSSDHNDGRPSGSCCCCCEDFTADEAIVRTPCDHYYHLECLGEWLKLAKTCPICRCDLDVATEVSKDLESQAIKGGGLSRGRSSVNGSGAGPQVPDASEGQ